MNPTPQVNPAIFRSRRIEAQVGEDYTVLAVSTRDVSLFAGCVTHVIKIGRGAYSKQMIIHAQGNAPAVGAPCKRMGGNGAALIWADTTGTVTGGGFTAAAVPSDWRS
jgi:hypothetical protein